MTYKEEQRLLDTKTKYRIKCKCGHTVMIYPFEHRKRKICDWCGKYVYANEKEQFKDAINLLLQSASK